MLYTYNYNVQYGVMYVIILVTIMCSMELYVCLYHSKLFMLYSRE